MLRRYGLWGLSALLSSCLAPISVDAPEDAGELVVEAYYNDRDSAWVKVSRTVPYFKEGRPLAVSNALILLQELESGKRDTLRWQDSLYVRGRGQGQVQPQAGHHYKLTVIVEGDTLWAETFLPTKVRIDTLFVVYRPAEGPLPAGNRLIGIAQDPPGEGQGYRVRFWRNDTLQNKLREWVYSDDRYIDGRLVLFELPFEVKSGDSVYVELWTMPVEVIRYYDRLVRNAFGGSGGFSPPPDNAYSNYQGGRRRVWGFFIAYAVDGWGLRVP